MPWLLRNILACCSVLNAVPIPSQRLYLHTAAPCRQLQTKQRTHLILLLLFPP